MPFLSVPLENLLRRMAETPESFLKTPAPLSSAATDKDVVFTSSIFNDLLWDLGLKTLSDEEWRSLAMPALTEKNRRLHVLLQLVFWLLGDPSLSEAENLRDRILDFASHPHVIKLAALVPPEQFVKDADRREELVRTVLDRLGLLPPDESEAQARDRLTTLDSVERARVIEETRAAAERARQLAEEMARREAEEAASKYQRE